MSSPAPTTKELLNRLASWKPSVRESAIEQAKQLEPDALLDLMQQGRKRLQRRRSHRWLFFLIYMFGGVIAAGFMGHDAFHRWKLIDRFIMPVVVWGLLFTGAPNLKASLVSVFEDMQDAAFVPHLLTLLASYGFADASKAQTALERLLPGMSRGQLDALTPLQRQAFLKPLVQSLKYSNRGKESEIHHTETILWTLEQIGGKREVGLVEQLAAIPIRTDMDRRIQQAAAECLPCLQIRAEEQRLQTTLLRASATAIGDTGNDLLRATVPALSTAPQEELLRATRRE